MRYDRANREETRERNKGRVRKNEVERGTSCAACRNGSETSAGASGEGRDLEPGISSRQQSWMPGTSIILRVCELVTVGAAYSSRQIRLSRRNNNMVLHRVTYQISSR